MTHPAKHHAPRKRFGQHFLADQSIVHRIVAALAPSKMQHLVEIGPGQGALTFPVLNLAGHLDVVELDRDLIPVLEERNRKHQDLRIHVGDALTFDFATLHNDERLLRIFGNLPYNISTPLIFHLLNYASIVDDMLFMLQKEVAERLQAKPNESAYGRLSVMVQYHCTVELLFNVPASAFYPPPQVESSIVHLIPHRQYPAQAKDFKLFETLVKHAFAQRRKTLRNSLKQWVSDATWESVQIRSDLRAENLSVADFVHLSNVILSG